MDELRVRDVDSSIVEHTVFFDEYIPVDVRSYAQPLGAGAVRLGDYSRTLLELTVECNSNRLRGATLTSVLELSPWPVVQIRSVQRGTPVLGTAFSERRVVSLTREFNVAVTESSILVYWAELEQCDACDCGRVQYLVAEGFLAGIRCTGLTQAELRLFRIAAEVNDAAATNKEI